jgi:hypothetical protein
MVHFAIILLLERVGDFAKMFVSLIVKFVFYAGFGFDAPIYAEYDSVLCRATRDVRREPNRFSAKEHICSTCRSFRLTSRLSGKKHPWNIIQGPELRICYRT